MELDEMKSAWRELDGRLDRQETLTQTFIRDAITTRSQRSVNRFLNMEIVGVAVCALLMPVVVRHYCLPWAADYPGMRTFMLFRMVLLALLAVWQLVKVRVLAGVDMSKAMKNNIRRVRRYELYAMAEKRVVIVLLPVMLAGVVALRAMWGTALWFWVLMVGMVATGVLFIVWYYKKFYADNMAAIKRGLDELEDL